MLEPLWRRQKNEYLRKSCWHRKLSSSAALDITVKPPRRTSEVVKDEGRIEADFIRNAYNWRLLAGGHTIARALVK
mgnify:CR=1 FL=1